MPQVSLQNVAALRNLCLQGSISQSAQVPALSQWEHPPSSSCISGNCVCTGGSHLHDHSCCCWREGAWFCLGVQPCSVLRYQSMAETAPSSRKSATGLFWGIQSWTKGVLLLKNSRSFKAHNSAFKTSQWELQLILLQLCIYLSHWLITFLYPLGVGFLLAW